MTFDLYGGYGGLLSPDEQQQAKQNMLLQFGLGLLAQSGPSPNKIGLGQALGTAGLGALQAQQTKLIKSKLDEANAEKKAREALPGLLGSPARTVPNDAQGDEMVDVGGTGLLGGKTQLPQFYAQLAGLGGEYSKLGIHGLVSMDPSGKEAPAAVKEWEYLKKQFPSMPMDFPTYLNVKRQGFQVTDIAGVPTLVSRSPGVPSTPLSTLPAEAAGQATVAGAKAGAEANQRTRATAQAEADISLGSTVDEISKMRSQVKDLMDAPGFNTIYGLSGKVDPRNYIAGTDAANAEARRQQLEASSFGISIQKMRGLGQLSDAEGKKVTAAYTRAINRNQSEEEARKAWGEVQQYLDLAEKRAYEKAGKPVNKSPSIDDLLKKYGGS